MRTPAYRTPDSGPSKTRVCGACGKTVGPVGKYCAYCGATVAASAAPVPAVKPNTAGKKKSPVKNLVAAAVIAALLAGVGLGGHAIYQNYQYNKAIDALNRNNYQVAYDLFTDLGNYKDSANYRKYSSEWLEYEKAIQEFESGNYATARSMFLSMKGFQHSADYVLECEQAMKYDDALSLYNKGEYEKAYDAFTALLNYKDSPSRAQSCIQPTPENGLVEKGEDYNTSDDCASLEVHNGRSYAIYLLFRTESGGYWGSMWISPYQQGEIEIPPGTYYVTLVTGSNWFGVVDLFGKDEQSYPVDWNGSEAWNIFPDATISIIF